MANLGFIGLGTMGGPMAKRLLDAGHQVIGHNRTRSRGQWLVDLGMGWSDSPREVAATADVTLTHTTPSVPPSTLGEGPTLADRITPVNCDSIPLDEALPRLTRTP